MSEVAFKEAPTESKGGYTDQYDVPMDTTHRCDRCGAQAYYKATNPAFENPLLFCNHHGAKHRMNLELQGFFVEDQSGRLRENTKPDSSAAA